MKAILCLVLLIPSLIFANFRINEESVRNLVSEGMTAYSDGDYAKAIDLFKEAFEHQKDVRSSAVAYNIARCYALLGEKDDAFNWLEKAFALGTFKFSDDSDLVSLKEDKRFQKLEKKAEKRIKRLESKEWKPLVTLPMGYKKENKYPVVVALHGFGSNPVSFSNVLSPRITPLGYILCCPYGPEIRGSTAFGWGEVELSEKRILEALETLKKKYRIDSERIILLGYSQGGGRAFYTGLKNPGVFQGIITTAGHYDESYNDLLKYAKEKGVKIYAMIGEKDHLLESNQKAEEAMKKVGIPVKLVVYPGLGHAFPKNSGEELRKALTWMEGGG